VNPDVAIEALNRGAKTEAEIMEHARRRDAKR
jgi:hypothetical protein